MRLYKTPLNPTIPRFISGYNTALIAADVGIVQFGMLMSNLYINEGIKLYDSDNTGGRFVLETEATAFQISPIKISSSLTSPLM